MIPKIIHYVWLGGNPLPPKMRECIDSWKLHMPDFEIMVWDDERIREIDNTFMHEALAERKWAFVSDVVRLYAVCKYGGIYLDTDVLVYKSFEPLLGNSAFIGRENSMHVNGPETVNYLTTCCFGAERGNPFVARCLEYYRNRRFVTSDDTTLPMELRLDVRLNSEIFTILAAQCGYNPSMLRNETQNCCGVLTVYPSWYFDPVGRKKDTYSAHLALGTWRECGHDVWHYTLSDKIAWRVWAVVGKVVSRFNRRVIKLK